MLGLDVSSSSNFSSSSSNSNNSSKNNSETSQTDSKTEHIWQLVLLLFFCFVFLYRFV